jgi:hypothetical protein
MIQIWFLKRDLHQGRRQTGGKGHFFGGKRKMRWIPSQRKGYEGKEKK